MRVSLVAALLIAGAPAIAAADDFGACAQDADLAAKYDGCSRLIAADPHYAAAFSGRGDALVGAGKPGEAIADYTQAIELDPKLAAAYYNRGLARLATGDAATAIADFSASIALSPNDATSYNGRGMANAAAGNFEAAAADFRKALALDNAYARAHLGLGMLQLRLGKLAEADTEFLEVLKRQPDDAEALAGRAEAAAVGPPSDGVVGSTTQMAPDLQAASEVPTAAAAGTVPAHAFRHRHASTHQRPNASEADDPLQIVRSR